MEKTCENVSGGPRVTYVQSFKRHFYDILFGNPPLVASEFSKMDIHLAPASRDNWATLAPYRALHILIEAGE